MSGHATDCRSNLLLLMKDAARKDEAAALWRLRRPQGQVVWVHRAEEAAMAASTGRFAMVLMDQDAASMLPALTRHIRRHQPLARIVVLAEGDKLSAAFDSPTWPGVCRPAGPIHSSSRKQYPC